MLNVPVSIVGTRIRTGHFAKPTAVDAIPLCPSSMHDPSVRRTWPRGYVHSISTLCDTALGRQSAVDQFLAKFSRNDVEVPSLDSARKQQVVVDPEDSSVLWLLLLFHPLLVGCMKAAVREVNADSAITGNFVRAYNGKRQRPLVRIAWRNSCPPHWMKIRSSNALVLKEQLSLL